MDDQNKKQRKKTILKIVAYAVIWIGAFCIALPFMDGRLKLDLSGWKTEEVVKAEMKPQTEPAVETASVVETETETETEAETETETEPETAEETETETEASDASCTLIAIGDMLMHAGISDDAYQADGSRNYDWLFEPILTDIQEADIAVVNNEVIFGGNEYGAKTYPDFNVFTELGDAEVKAGFDITLNATNHVMDMWDSGIWNTLNYWKDHPEVLAAGIHDSAEDQDEIKIIERNGIKIAIYNCTYNLNGHSLPEGESFMVDLMDDEHLSKIASYLERAEREADFTIVFPHWGDEYSLHHNERQEYLAKFFVSHGADLIIGTHPHCLQDIAEITTENGNHALCYYSLGNYVSLQNKTITMVEGMAKITITKSDGDTYISDNGIDFLVNYYESNLVHAKVYKLSDFTAELAASHGINTTVVDEDGFYRVGLDGDGYNIAYPMTLDGIRKVIIDSVGEEYLPAS